MSSRAVTLILIIDGVFSMSILQCPLNKTEWESRSAEFYCQGNDVYHCFLMEDTLSRKEKCIETTTIGEEHCPIFTTTGYLHWKSCNTTGCPKGRYRSDEVYKYPICYGDIKEPQRPEENNGRTGLGLALGLGIGVSVTFITFLVIFIIARLRHKETNSGIETGNRENEVELNNLITQNPIKDESVANGVAVLASGKLLYLVGKLGNAVSTTGKDIVKTFAQKHNMEPCYYNYLDIPNEFPSETVNFVDGWCGLWNNNPCEMQTTREKLSEIISCCKKTSFNIKFVVGIRTDVRRELRKQKIHFSEYKTLLLDTFSKSKLENIAKKLESTQANCTVNGCICTSLVIENVTDISNSHIGTPLIVNLMDIDHSMIQGFLAKKTGPMKTMKNHIKDLQSTDTELFNFLLYIVIVGYYDQHEFSDEFAREFDIAQSCFEDFASLDRLQNYTKVIEKSKLSPMWSAKISKNDCAAKKEGTSSEVVRVFWHSFLYICAFHVCFASYPEKMMRICNIDALLQLLRPETWKTEPFTVAVNTTLIDIFRERIKGTLYEEKLSKHPLIKSSERKDFEGRNMRRKRSTRASNFF